MILHIDMDAFYASVEQLDNPWLQGKCVIVGGTSNRGVVSAASYEARHFGVHSAMPVFQARQKCPDGIFVPPRMARYKEVSDKIMDILREFSPLVEVVSIDEAYLDITGTGRLHGDPQKIASAIKQEIKAAIHLTCSVGIAPVKFLAKIASDLDKPDGMTLIPRAEVAQFIQTLPVGKVPGVGRKMHAKLMATGIRYLGDVKKFPEELLVRCFGKYGSRLLALAQGRDYSDVTPHSAHKSISTERTLGTDTRDLILLKQYLLKQSEEVARQLRKTGVRGKTITIKIKHADFKLNTRSTTLDNATQSSKTIYRHALRLLDGYHLDRKVRLIGVGASGLTSTTRPTQLDLFDRSKETDKNWEKIDHTLDSIQNKFGRSAIRRATLED